MRCSRPQPPSATRTTNVRLGRKRRSTRCFVTAGVRSRPGIATAPVRLRSADVHDVPVGPPPARIRRHGFIPRMAELNRHSVMLMTGLGALAAAIPVPEAVASVSKEDAPAGRGQAPEAPPPGGTAVTYLFQDDFDGPAGSAPDPTKWEVARARESMEDPTFWELPE